MSDDYVSRGKLVQKAIRYEINGFSTAKVVLLKDILDASAADVRPVVRGKWIRKQELINPIDGIWGSWVECSNCRGVAFNHEVFGYQRDNFCHHCGADMRGLV